jgi:cyclopropane-fatty-acyl-phospholipid synthase
MKSEVRTAKELLALAGVEVNGGKPWDIQVNDDRFYARVLDQGGLGLGESYMDGWWDCDRLDELIYRILKADLTSRVGFSFRLLWPAFKSKLINLQTKARAKKVAYEHYDLGNDLFSAFLDPYRQYSCAYFHDGESLEQAQINKMRLIAQKLNVAAGERVLDIGFGWGGLARFLAENYHCRVTGVNISSEQVAFAREFCSRADVEILERDYREVTGEFDKIVSVGMFEHVGARNYREFMEVAARSLKHDGVFLLHTIGRNESADTCEPWISKYIFPNSMLPSVAQISEAAEGLFMIEDLHNLGPHYDKTLLAWHGNFQREWPKLAPKYGERFKRMWDYYLLACAGAFRARDIQLWQIALTKYGCDQPNCRMV